MPTFPSGTVTFLFTDIEGSTALWDRDRVTMREAVDRHLTILQSFITAHHGVLYKTVGDGTQSAFASAEEALRAAVGAQRALLAEVWGDPPESLRVRMALHAGEAVPDERGDYLAAPLNRLARILSTSHGGQIVLTQAVQQLTRGELPPGTELRDLGEHRLRDLREPERVFQLWHMDLAEDFPPLTSLDARPNTLPRQPTTFLGREHEVGEIAALLRRSEVQLVTLTGAGGTGKTRLALQAATELLDAFTDGVVFVPLASLADAALVPAAIATALGVREEGGQPLPERLAAFLAGKQVLLVIDNWEHLLEGAPVLSTLLQGAPGVTVLATSRAPLRLRAEREYPVPPLALPRRQPPPTLSQLSQYEAVRLFIERAQAVKPDFAIDNESAPAVAEICHRLDGLPLAIELAAARLRLLPPQAMLARLEQRLPLLTGGSRDAPARQQTLRQTIAWSYDLLQPEEQTLFRRLAVFSGGFGFEAAEAVANPDGDVDVLTGISALVDHSLVQQAKGGGGEPRFTMLETIREFGLERLVESDEEADARDRHAAYFLELARRAETDPDPRRMLARYDSERTNLRSALTHLAGCEDAERLLELASIISGPWTHFGHAEEARDWLERGLAAGDAIMPRLRSRALSGLAAVLFQLRGEPVEALACGEEALTLARGEDDWASIAKAAHWAGLSALWLDHPRRSAALFQESRAALLQFPAGATIKRELAHLDNLLGQAALAQGDIAQAEQLFTKARDCELAMEQELGVFPLIAYPLIGLGHVARCRGDAVTALARYQEGLAIAAEFGDVRAITLALGGVAGALAALGRWREAATQFGATEALCDRVGISFAMRPLAWQTAAGLPEPWQRRGASFTWPQALRAATATATAPLPPLADPILAEALWTAGRALDLNDAVSLALSSDLTLPPEPVAT